jgi:hypothetical protein
MKAIREKLDMERTAHLATQAKVAVLLDALGDIEDAVHQHKANPSQALARVNSVLDYIRTAYFNA